MKNLVRALIDDNQATITYFDGTAVVKEGIKLHKTNRKSSEFLARALLYCGYLSALLKEETADVSLSLKTDGVGVLTASGNQKLFLRASIENPCADESWLKDGETVSVIRQDGGLPFVGAILAGGGDPDDDFTAYFSKSEQIPTKVQTSILFDETGELIFAGLVAVQLLPFASDEEREKLKRDYSAELTYLEKFGAEKCAEKYKDGLICFSQAQYRCNCSRKYLSGVLLSLSKDELLSEIERNGKIEIHCHCCNRDYVFEKDDIEKLLEENQ